MFAIPSFPSTIFLFISTTTPCGQIGELLAIWAGRPDTYLRRLDTPWLPYKRTGKGSLLLHPTSNLKFSESFSNFLAYLSYYKSLSV
jgi:hypothetical protein